MSYQPQNPNGQATSANSEPVVIASDQSAVPISATTLPLPTGAATSTVQTNGSQKTQIVDGSGNVINSVSNALNVNVASGSNIGVTDGTNTANIQAGDQNGLVVNNNTKTINFSTSTTGAQTLLANTDCRGYTFMTLVVQSAGTGLGWSGQWSPTSGGTYASYSAWTNITAGSNNPYNGLTTAVGITTTSVYGDFFQLALTAMTGGTTSGYIILSSLPHNPTAITGIVGTSSTNTSGTITAANSTVTQSSLQLYNSGFVPVSVHGTYSGVSFSIAMSDDNGVTLYNTAVFNSSTAAWIAPGATITPGTNASVIYWVPVPPNSSSTTVKVTASAYTSGTANVRIGGASGSTQPGSYMSQIMDAAGNARGVNVDASNNLNTHDVASSATGSAVPGTAHYMGMLAGSNLTGLQSAGTSGDGASTSALDVGGRNYNGTNWDRNRSATSASGTTGTGLLGVGALGIYNSSPPTGVSGDYYQLQLDSSANLKVNVAAASGLTVQPGNTPNTTPWLMSLQPATTGGWSVSSQTALTNTVVSIKASAGQFGGYMFNNPNAAVMYIQIFNVASGSVTLGTTAPTYVIPISAASSANVEFANGIAHATAIACAATTTATGNAAPTTGLTGFFIFK